MTHNNENTLSVGNHKLIYAFSVPDSAQHEGRIKVGDATIKLPEGFTDFENLSEQDMLAAAKYRIDQYSKTMDTQCEILHVEMALRDEIDPITKQKTGKLEGFRDYSIHQVLKNSGYDKDLRRQDKSNGEWFSVTIDIVKAAIKAYKNHRNFIDVEDTPVIELYPEQKDAVAGTLQAFKGATFENPKKALWNAKMRFGKTLTSYALANELKNTFEDFDKVLIITHFPSVRDGWREDYQKSPLFSTGWNFGDKTMGVTFEDVAASERFIWFASIQDLRGSYNSDNITEADFAELAKNSELFQTEWDLVITDEVHMGTLTDLAIKMFSAIKSARYLDLSGTPFNVTRIDEMEGEERVARFTYDHQYNWSYVQEQAAKKAWDENPETVLQANPYANRPEVKFITYDIENIVQELSPEAQLKISFNLSELFRVRDDNKTLFVHERAVKDMLNKIRGEERFNKTNAHLFPFSGAHGLDFAHTLWMLPNVPAVNAMETLLKRQGSGFEGYKVINATGEGLAVKDLEEASALGRVKNAINKYERTITLSQQMLTTGVTVPEWNAVLMLNNTTSAMTYMQTAFRAASSGTLPDGRVKDTAFIFDFNPNRCLKVVVETAKINASRELEKAVTENEAKETVKKFVEQMPILSFDGATFVERNSDEIMYQINEEFINETVEKGFDSKHILNRPELENLGFTMVRVLEALRKTSGNTQRSGEIKVSQVSPATQKLLDEYNKKVEAGQKTTPEEKAAARVAQSELSKAEKEDRKSRDNATKVIVSILSRIPMLVFAAELPDNKISIETFNELIDDESWNEFMDKNLLRVKPEGEKDLIERLDLFETGEPIKFYWEDVFPFFNKNIFEGACQKVREMVDRANEEEDFILQALYKIQIFGTFRNPDKETVLTPARVVQLQLNSTLGGIELFDLEKSTAKDFYVWVKDSDGNRSSVMIDEAVVKLRDGELTLDYGFKTVEGHEDFWTQKTFTMYDPNSKSALYPLFAAMSRFVAWREKEAILSEPELWNRIIDKEIFVNTRVKYSELIARRMLSSDGHPVNATTIDIVKLLKTMKEYNAIKKADQPLFYKKFDNVHEAVGVILRLAQDNFMKLYANKEEQELLANERLLFNTVVGIIKLGDYDLEDMMEVQKLIEAFNNKLPRFEAVVSNPPYSEVSQKIGGMGPAIYQDFFFAGSIIAKKMSLIHPAKFLYGAGGAQGLEEMKLSFVKDSQIPYISIEKDTTKIFNEIDLSGGIILYLWESDFSGETEVFINSKKAEYAFSNDSFYENKLYQIIIEKINYSLGNFANIYGDSYGLPTNFRNSLEKFGIYHDLVEITNNEYSGLLLHDTDGTGIFNKKRKQFELPEDWMPDYTESKLEKFKEQRDKWCLHTPLKYGRMDTPGEPSNVIGTLFIGKPGEIITGSYVTLGTFPSEEEALNAQKYFKTDFARFLIKAQKGTDTVAKKFMEKLPVQDFTSSSKINWNKSINEIESNLYSIYNLTDEEIAYIKSEVTPFEDSF